MSSAFLGLLGVILFLVSADSAENGELIIGGRPCPAHSQPWQVALMSGSTMKCGGILITNSWVLSAAHCEVTRSFSVRLGKHNLWVSERSEQVKRISKIIVHPNYVRQTFNNDIVLIKLHTPAHINRKVRTLPLATRCPVLGRRCVVSGWGTTTSPQLNFPHVLQCATISIINPNVCQSTYKYFFRQNMVCAGRMEGGTDACRGDSGGPLVCDGKLQGVISFGRDVCAQPKSPGVYVNVCNYVNWIHKIIRSN